MNDDYRRYLASSHWKATRAAKAKAAGYRCQRCGEYGRRTRESVVGLHVHHLSYERLGHEEMDDLELLCVACHELEHGLGDGSEERRNEIRTNLSRKVAGRVTVPYAPDEIDLEIASWDDLARQAGF